MKKMFFLAATVALALSSCSSDELVQDQPVAEDGAVVFSAYTGRDTRAEKTTDKDQKMTTELLRKKGFGVFAYEQGSTELISYLASNTYPNFMYNQKVEGYTNAGAAMGESGSFDHWDYTPHKYWPNNNGYVTYQAYAPYKADITPVFGVAQNGAGIRYNNSENYDLLWGASTDAADSKCILNQTKPAVGKEMKFYFKHALSKLDFTVSYFSDNIHAADNTSAGPADGTLALSTGTKIVVRSIKLVGDLPSTGVVSLYDGKWTIERTDANIGFNTADLVNKRTYTSSTWTWDKISDETQYGTLTPTIPAVKPAESLMVIPTPNSSTKVHVEVTYDVITEDTTDPRNTSVVTNTVTSKDDADNLYPTGHGFEGISLTAGKWTTVNIHLGLTSVVFDAEVVDWGDTENQDVDLPNNGFPGLTAATVSTLKVVDAVPAEAGTEGEKVYVASTTNKVYTYSTSLPWTFDATVDNEVIYVNDTWYKIASGIGTEIGSSQVRYYKNGKYYTMSDFSDSGVTPAALADGYYIIGGVVYKK